MGLFPASDAPESCRSANPGGAMTLRPHAALAEAHPDPHGATGWRAGPHPTRRRAGRRGLVRPVRVTCRRCLRPELFCVCDVLPALSSRTRVVILQHPREARLAICSAWLCHAALPGSELIVGVRFDEHPRVRALCAEPGTSLLFPGPEATPATALAGAPPSSLMVVDSTWPQAVKLLRKNPRLAALPRVSIEGVSASGYEGLRREPAPGHLATIDAVAEALGALEGDPARYQPMRTAFRLAVERQLACSRDDRRRPRHRPGAKALAGG
jgi:DTW domain-containing protein